MSIEIKNPAEDQYGNSKDNIFLAFNKDGSYFGSAYVFPADINHYQIAEIPLLIFIGMNIEAHIEEMLKDEVTQKLFDRVVLRAKEIRMERPDLNARVYSGFEYDMESMNFYIKNGFHEDYSIIMEASIDEDFKYELPEGTEVVEVDLSDDKELMAYKELYDEIFISPLETDTLIEQSGQNHFRNLYFLTDGKRCGGCTVFEKDGFGYIETLYVLPHALGKGLSKIILKYIFDYFLANGLNKTKLEVWELNKRAVKLYKSFGYQESEKSFMFPGITL